jgi:hypothetical protein
LENLEATLLKFECAKIRGRSEFATMGKEADGDDEPPAKGWFTRILAFYSLIL